jgi:hypothetical protein
VYQRRTLRPLRCPLLPAYSASICKRRLVADIAHTFIGPFEKNKTGRPVDCTMGRMPQAAYGTGHTACGRVTCRARLPCPSLFFSSDAACPCRLPSGSGVAHKRDQDVSLDFNTLAKALTKIARGEVSRHSSTAASAAAEVVAAIAAVAAAAAPCKLPARRSSAEAAAALAAVAAAAAPCTVLAGHTDAVSCAGAPAAAARIDL